MCYKICLIFNIYKIWGLKSIKIIAFQEMSSFCIHDTVCTNITAVNKNSSKILNQMEKQIRIKTESSAYVDANM